MTEKFSVQEVSSNKGNRQCDWK